MAAARGGRKAQADKRLAQALRKVEKGASLRQAARASHVSRERLSVGVTKAGLGKPEARKRYVPQRTLLEARTRREHEAMNKAVRDIEQGASIRDVARRKHLSRERVSTRLKELEMVAPTERGKRLKLVAAAGREMITYSAGQIEVVRLSFGEASRNSFYLHTLYKAMNEKSPSGEWHMLLAAMIPEADDEEGSGGVTDIYGVFHPWEFDIDKIRFLTMGGNVPEYYRLVA